MQDWSRDTLSFQFNATVARRDAKVLSLNLHAGARQARGRHQQVHRPEDERRGDEQFGGGGHRAPSTI